MEKELKNINVRNGNILTSKTTDNKVISINLDRVDYWKEDIDKSFIELHLFNCNFNIWINISEKEFRNLYLKYKNNK